MNVTIGDVVLFFDPNEVNGRLCSDKRYDPPSEYVPAIVTNTHYGSSLINLTVCGYNGDTGARERVALIQPGQSVPKTAYCVFRQKDVDLAAALAALEELRAASKRTPRKHPKRKTARK